MPAPSGRQLVCNAFWYVSVRACLAIYIYVYIYIFAIPVWNTNFKEAEVIKYGVSEV